MWYVVNAETEQILSAQGRMPPDAQRLADYFACPVYVIRGEHSGLSAEPKKENDDEKV